MADFLAQPTHETDVPQIEVTVDPNKPIPTGRHQFQLVVIDDSGNKSEPDVVDVIIRDTVLPTAVVNAVPAQPDRTKTPSASTRMARKTG